MTEAELKKVVSEAVSDTLTRLGIEVDDPLKVQRDLQFLRRWRESSETVTLKGLTTAFALIVTGVLGLVYMKLQGQ